MMLKTFLSVCLLVFSMSTYAIDHIMEMLGGALQRQIILVETGDKLNLNGYAIRTLEGEEIYVGALYTLQPEKRVEILLTSDDPMVMAFYFVQDDISSQWVIQNIIENLYLNAKSRKMDWLDKHVLDLKAVLNQSLNAGDILMFQYTPQQGLQMLLNGQVKYRWPHAKAFFNSLLRTWIGPYPPSRAFKQGILNFPSNG
jgi:hypothetical protein